MTTIAIFAELIIVLLASSGLAFAQIGGGGINGGGGAGGGGVCAVSGTQTTGYVLTATNSGKGCSWQTVGGATVDANTLKNAWYIADGGSANAITGTTTTAFPGAYAAGQVVIVKSNATNSGATTININSLGVKNVTKNGATALAAGNKVSGQDYVLAYDGAQFEMLNFTLLATDIPQNTANDTNVTLSYSTGTMTAGWTGALAAARLNSNVVQSVTNDTNVTGNISAQALTLGWTGTLAVARGGTGTASPALVAGTNVTITGSWPNQTINSSGGGGSGCVPAGTIGQILTDSGSGTCTSNTTGTGIITALGVNIGSAGAPVLFNGALGTPSSGTLTNATGLPISGITGLGTGVGTWLATPSGANLASALTTSLPSSKGGTGIANTATLTLGSSNQNWATLGTGIVKNTTTTGALSDAASSDVTTLWTGTCSSSTFLRGDGACATPGGSGTVTVVGAGSLTSTALVTGGGTTTIQTPSATATMDSSGNIVTPGGITTGSGGSVGGYYAFGQGTATTAPTSSVGFMAPTSVTTKFMMTLPAAPTTGFMLNTGTTDPSTISFVAPTGSGNVVLATSPTLVTPALGTPSALVLTNATALPAAQVSSGALANGMTATTQAAGSNDTKLATDAYVDATKCTTTKTTGTSATLSTCFTVNQEATAATGVTYTLPTAANGLQFCIDNDWNGSAATTGVLTFATSASGQFMTFTDGTLTATGGNVTSGGAARDGACAYGIDSTHWMFVPHSGVWSKH